MKFLISSTFVFLISTSATAAMTSFGFAGVVKSFDKDTVVVEVQGQKISVPKSQVSATKIKSGEAVYINLSMEQMNQLFNKNRNTASESK